MQREVTISGVESAALVKFDDYAKHYGVSRAEMLRRLVVLLDRCHANVRLYGAEQVLQEACLNRCPQDYRSPQNTRKVGLMETQE